MSGSGAPRKCYTERGARRVFAGGIDWPGWCRGARDEDGALEALLAYGPRYAAVLREAHLAFRPPDGPGGLVVVERLRGDATTDFGAPGIAPSADDAPVNPRQLARLRNVLEACWSALGRAAEAAEGVDLRKGPRGGGRDLDGILAHVAGAEAAYLGKLAVPRPSLSGLDARDALDATNAAAAEALAASAARRIPATGPRGGVLWSARYFVRRDAWHVLDHAWEIEDRSPA